MTARFHAVPLPREPHPAKGSPPGDVLARVFGHPGFRGVQGEAVAHVMAGRDVLALMPTGGGKSMAYQVPAMSLPGTALVVSPLVALMRDQCDALRRRGVRAAALVGERMMGAAEREETERALASGDLDVVYASPEGLRARGLSPLRRAGLLSLVAVDEAHCVCEWGHSFRPDYLAIPDALAAFPRRPRVALTASASPEVRDEVAWRLLAPGSAVVSGGFDRPNVRLEASIERRPLEALLSLLSGRPRGEPALAYCRTRGEAERTASALSRAGHAAACYHAGLPEGERNAAQDAFLSGKVRVVAATSAFGMGIDKPDVGLVAHLGMPSSLEAYYQETGRAGRDGREALAWLAWNHGAAASAAGRVASEADPAAAARAEARFEAVMAYAESHACRRAVLLRRFGERYLPPCGACDRCLRAPALADDPGRAGPLLAAAASLDGTGRLEDLVGGLAGLARGVGEPWLGALAADGAAGVRRLFRQCAAAGLVGLGERDAAVRILPDGLAALRDGARVALPVRGSRRIPRPVIPHGLPDWRAGLWDDLRGLLGLAGDPSPEVRATRLVAAAGDPASLASACAGLGPGLAEAVEAAAAARRPPAAASSAPAFDLF